MICSRSTVGQGSRFTVMLPLLNRGDMVGERSEREQAHAAEKNGLVGHT